MHFQCNQVEVKKQKRIANVQSSKKSCIKSKSAFKRKNSVYINISSGLQGIVVAQFGAAYS